MAAHRPKENLQRKVVWQTKAYFVCPDCQCTWQLDLGAASR